MAASVCSAQRIRGGAKDACELRALRDGSHRWREAFSAPELRLRLAEMTGACLGLAHAMTGVDEVSRDDEVALACRASGLSEEFPPLIEVVSQDAR
jgi:hypothetical protein